MLYAIAKIFNEDSLYGYRILNSDTEKVNDCKINSVAEAMSTKGVKIQNMTIDSRGPMLVEEDCSYDVVNTGSKEEINNRVIIVIERLSLIEYKCTDYTGKIKTMTLNNLINTDNKVIIVNGCIKDNKEIIMDNTYSIDLDMVKYLEKKMGVYKAKAALIGDISLGIEIIGHDAVITSAHNYIGKVVIPSFVTAIWERAFSNCSNIKSVTLPENIKYIGSAAFSYCKHLNHIDMADVEIDLASGVFSRCVNLNSIRLSNKLRYIPRFAFEDCCKLDNVDIPVSIEYIDKKAFAFCESLTRIKFNGKIKRIGDNVFDNCSGLSNIELPHIENTGVSIFSECTGLSDVKLNYIDSIREEMFYGCEKLKTLTIPEGVKEIEYKAFEGCTELRTVVLPSKIPHISSNAFYNVKHEVELVVSKGASINSIKNTVIRHIDK